MDSVWQLVKSDMLRHLKDKLDFYLTLWFTIPYCALIACNTYDIAITTYSEQQSILFVPFFSLPSSVHPIILFSSRQLLPLFIAHEDIFKRFYDLTDHKLLSYS
ncbi:uncharacterized protein BYT42DRAFT_572937, partial [Radiomyces spectabilis]|uniref:uncharacterized protein n=1 Tax=Radiomyces spectabilis TaxID=64574 RepID=UPI002220B1CD